MLTQKVVTEQHCNKLCQDGVLKFDKMSTKCQFPWVKPKHQTRERELQERFNVVAHRGLNVVLLTQAPVGSCNHLDVWPSTADIAWFCLRYHFADERILSKSKIVTKAPKVWQRATDSTLWDSYQISVHRHSLLNPNSKVWPTQVKSPNNAVTLNPSDTTSRMLTHKIVIPKRFPSVTPHWYTSHLKLGFETQIDSSLCFRDDHWAGVKCGRFFSFSML